MKKIVFVRETGFYVPGNYPGGAPIHEIWDAICKSETRNGQIAADIARAADDSRFGLVLSERKEHLARLSDLLKQDRPDIELGTLIGGMGKKARNAALASIRDARMAGRPACLFATGSLIGEGFDLPELDTLFITMPVSFRGKLVQYAGRIERSHVLKREIRIYDYFDSRSGITIAMFRKRMATYKTLNYEIVGLPAGRSAASAQNQLQF